MSPPRLPPLIFQLSRRYLGPLATGCAELHIRRFRPRKQLLEMASEKAGRERKLFFNAVPIQQICDRWTTQYRAFWAGHLVDIQARIEAGQEKKRHA